VKQTKKNFKKEATQPQALSPYNPTAGSPLDINNGGKASICCLGEVGAGEKQGDAHTHTHMGNHNVNKLF